jgi:hypothetical protein
VVPGASRPKSWSSRAVRVLVVKGEDRKGQEELGM